MFFFLLNSILLKCTLMSSSPLVGPIILKITKKQQKRGLNVYKIGMPKDNINIYI